MMLPVWSITNFRTWLIQNVSQYCSQSKKRFFSSKSRFEMSWRWGDHLWGKSLLSGFSYNGVLCSRWQLFRLFRIKAFLIFPFALLLHFLPSWKEGNFVMWTLTGTRKSRGGKNHAQDFFKFLTRKRWKFFPGAKMAEMPTSTTDVPDVPTVTIVHKVKSKHGYTEIHSTAEGFGDNTKVLFLKWSLPADVIRSRSYVHTIPGYFFSF